jgi:hypothetical protein
LILKQSALDILQDYRLYYHYAAVRFSE